MLSERQAAEMQEHRRRYEALKQAGTGAAPRALPPATEPGAVPLAEADVIGADLVPGGGYVALRLWRGERLRLVDRDGTSALTLHAWNAHDPSERLNPADTMKIQWSAALRKGRVLFSDMGRVILSLVEDTSGAHDALAGGSTAASTLAHYGPGPFPNARDNVVQGTLKLGLGRRDIGSGLSFFAPVTVAADGGLQWDGTKKRAGNFVDLRADIDLLVVVSNTPHPLDPSPTYAPGAADVIRVRGVPAEAEDLCRTASVEARRGFENTDRYLAR